MRCPHRDKCDQEGMKRFFRCLKHDEKGEVVPFMARKIDLFREMACPELKKLVRKKYTKTKSARDTGVDGMPEHHRFNFPIDNLYHFLKHGGKKLNTFDPLTGPGAKGITVGERADLLERFENPVNWFDDADPCLDQVEQKIIHMREHEGFTYSEIAERCGIKEGTIRKKYSRAKQRLKKDPLRIHRKYERLVSKKEIEIRPPGTVILRKKGSST